MLRKKIKVPSDQTVVLKGLKSYTGKTDIESFLQKIECKPMFPPNPITNKDDPSTKLVFLNFESTSLAAKAVELIRSIEEKPMFIDTAKFSVCIKSKKNAQGASSSAKKNTDESSSDSEDSDDETFAEYVVKYLQSKGGSMDAGPIGSLARKKKSWQSEVASAGGLKSYVQDHDNKLEFLNDGGCGTICIVKNPFKSGDRVKVKESVSTPKMGWGDISAWSIGTIKKTDGNMCIVDFPSHRNWRGRSDDLEKAPAADISKQNCGEVDTSIEDYGFVKFEGKEIKFTGSLDPSIIQNKQKYGFVRARQRLTPENPYYEVRVITAASTGIGIGVSTTEFRVSMMPGWDSSSYGFHTDDGKIFHGNGQGFEFGPKASVGDTIGCGVLFQRNKPTTLFFTRNRECIGRIPMTSQSMLYPVVASSWPSVIEINLKASFEVPPACSLKNVKNGSETKYHNLSQAISNLSAGDVLMIAASGVHFFLESLVLKQDCQVMGSNDKDKPIIINGNGERVLVCSSNSSVIKDLCVRSMGGDIAKTIFNGACGIVLLSGRLFIENCMISSNKGSAVGMIEGTSLIQLKATNCTIGHCGRHGVVVHDCIDGVEIIGCTVSNCKMVGIALNPGSKCTYKILDTKIKNCVQGIKMLSSSATLDGVSFESCAEEGFLGLAENAARDRLQASFTNCSFIKSSIKAQGKNAELKFDEKCVLPDSGPLTSLGAKIILKDSDTKHSRAKQSSLQEEDRNSKDSEEAVAVVSQVSEKADQGKLEKDNFGRLCRLLLEVCPFVLLTAFRSCFESAEKRKWSQSCGANLLAAMDDFSQRKIGKTATNKIKEGKCEVWDVSILCSLLLHSPGYLKSDSKMARAVEQLREQRNQLVHEQIVKGLSIPKEEFEKEWGCACAALKILISTFSDIEAKPVVEKISKIEAERFSDSQVDEFVEQMQVQLREISDKAEDALLKAENAATRSEMDRTQKRIIALEELILKNGDLDVDRLPQTVELSNKANYHMTNRIGEGGMGTVFAARIADGSQVALKICEISGVDRGDREANILEKLLTLQHPNIVRFLDSARLKSRLVIVMELVKGQSLERWLDSKYTADGMWPVSCDESKDIMLQLTNGVSAVHEMRIAHRDLKPANVMFDEVTQHVVIVDFGLSKEQNANQTVTQATCIVGTTMYMSPEQLIGNTRDIDIRTDIWSLGVIHYEILTGLTPFAPKTTSRDTGEQGSGSASRRKLTFSKAEEGKMTTAILDAPVPNIPNIPPSIQDVISRALMKDKKDRYQNGKDMNSAYADAWERVQSSAVSTKSKPIKEWNVDDVVALFKTCNFEQAVKVVTENSIDGKTLLDLTDEDLMDSVENGGLGLKKLQIKRFRQELQLWGSS